MGAPTRVTAKNNGKIVEPFASGGNKVRSFTYFAGPASYTTGGDTLNAEDLNLKWLVHLPPVYAEDGTSLMVFIFPTGGAPSKTVKCMILSIAGVEVGNASNQSAKRYRISAIGTY